MVRMQQQNVPLDYRHCNQLITIYHRSDTVTHRIVIEGAYFGAAKQHGLNKTGETESNAFLVVIPESRCHYVPPDIYDGAEGTYTIAVKDKVLHGAGPVIETSAEWTAFIPAAVHELVVVQKVAPFYWHGKVCHVEAMA